MNRLWKNNEGYSDPTAGKALSNIVHENKRRAAALARESRRKSSGIKQLPIHLLTSLSNAVCAKHGFKRILPMEMQKLYNVKFPQPIIRENGDSVLWVDVNYLALQIDAGPVQYLYLNRVHINEERSSYREASKERGEKICIPGDINAQFEKAMRTMNRTETLICITEAAKAYGLSWVSQWRRNHEEAVDDGERISGTGTFG